MKTIFPQKLKKGDHIRVVAPSKSLGIISEENRKIANDRLEALGFTLSFGKHVEEIDQFNSSSVKSRAEDLNDAFADKSVDGVLAVIGGENSNQLLRDIDWKIIKKNPKFFCGFSDITALNHAIFAKCGLVNYSGPSYSTFGRKLGFDYDLEYFQKCVFLDKPFEIIPSKQWSDDKWYEDQDKRIFMDNEGPWVFHEGKVKGTILGANLCTFNLLQGTEFFPSLTNSILFLEDDFTSNAETFDRNLQSVIHLKEFSEVRGLVIGRFQKTSKTSRSILEAIVETKKELKNLPVIANVDFGHTSPLITFPIGGTAKIEAKGTKSKIVIEKH